MITYLLKSSACIAFVYIIYLAFFRQTNRFQLNRAYLLVGLVLSFVVPIIVMPAASVNIVTTVISGGYVTGSDLPVPMRSHLKKQTFQLSIFIIQVL